MHAAVRGADLTAKLLAYARKGKTEMAVVDVHQVIGDVIEISKHTLPKKIEICRMLAAKQTTVVGDRNQLQNALTNLVINARDAMPDGGILTFMTALFTAQDSTIGSAGHAIEPDRYIKCSLKDTGIGMDEKTLVQAFEPFFTTKKKIRARGSDCRASTAPLKATMGMWN